MPSMNTLVWLELVPRMNTEVSPPGPPVCTTLSPGMSLSTSAKVRSWRASMSAAVTTVMLLATCSSGVGMRVAVITTDLQLIRFGRAAQRRQGCQGERQEKRGTQAGQRRRGARGRAARIETC